MSDITSYLYRFSSVSMSHMQIHLYLHVHGHRRKPTKILCDVRHNTFGKKIFWDVNKPNLFSEKHAIFFYAFVHDNSEHFDQDSVSSPIYFIDRNNHSDCLCCLANTIRLLQCTAEFLEEILMMMLFFRDPAISRWLGSYKAIAVFKIYICI